MVVFLPIGHISWQYLTMTSHFTHFLAFWTPATQSLELKMNLNPQCENITFPQILPGPKRDVVVFILLCSFTLHLQEFLLSAPLLPAVLDHIVACSIISFVWFPLSISSSLLLPKNSLLFSPPTNLLPPCPCHSSDAQHHRPQRRVVSSALQGVFVQQTEFKTQSKNVLAETKSITATTNKSALLKKCNHKSTNNFPPKKRRKQFF